MNKQSPFRLVLNLMLIVIAVISVVATGFVSIKGYLSNKIPEICSDKQIIEVVKETYSDFEFDMDDDWKIKTHLLDDNRSFIADVDIIRGTDTNTAYYGVQLTFKFKNGSWELVKYPYEISLRNNEWNFENSEWTVTAEDGSTYEVTFLSDYEAKLSIRESADTSTEQTSVNVLDGELEDEGNVIDNTTNEEIANDEAYSNDSNIDEDDTDDNLGDSNNDESFISAGSQERMLTCVLSESEDGTYLQGSFEVFPNEPVMLVVTRESVKIILSNEDGELILAKK